MAETPNFEVPSRVLECLEDKQLLSDDLPTPSGFTVFRITNTASR